MYSGRVSSSSSMCGTRLLRQNVPYASYSLNENIFTQNVAPGWAYMVRLEVARSSVFCVMFCRTLIVHFLLASVLSVLRYTASDYSFGIFNVLLSLMKT
jgi:hypothetical protein